MCFAVFVICNKYGMYFYFFENKVNCIEPIAVCRLAVTYNNMRYFCAFKRAPFVLCRYRISFFISRWVIPPVLLVSLVAVFLSVFFYVFPLSRFRAVVVVNGGTVILYRCISPVICANKIYCSFFSFFSHVQSIFSFRNLLFTRCIPFSE